MDIVSLRKANAETLTKEFQWLSIVIETAMQLHWNTACEYATVFDVPPPDISGEYSNYALLIVQHKMTFAERVILALALAPHLQPALTDVFLIKNPNTDKGYTEFGGIRGKQHAGFLPTGETAAFILAGDNLESRFTISDIFNADHFFYRDNILELVNGQSYEPSLSGLLHVSEEFVNYFTTGATHKPLRNINFPAVEIKTPLEWTDLVLDHHTMQEVMEIQYWIEHGQTLLTDWGMIKKIKPGFRSFFYGPPGTGKTLTASLLGKSTGLVVYRIDMAMAVSKYIGETEKIMADIFYRAEKQHCILFFDNADALFGKRTQPGDSHDRYANRETSYLLQRIEDFPGVVIIAANLKANIDEAFTRRFQSMIYFPVPDAGQRLKLWQNAFSHQTITEDDIDFRGIAEEYKLTGAAIMNISRYCMLMALKDNRNVILKRDMIEGIRREVRNDE